MQALTKTPRIEPHLEDDARVFTVSCPKMYYESVIEFLREKNCEIDEEGRIPDEVVFPDRTPGTIIRGLRYRDCLTQEALSKLAGIPRRHISEMENGKRSIGKQNARKLAAAFNTDPRMFLFA